MAQIEETLERGGSLRTSKNRLPIGRDRTYALRDESGNITNNIDEFVKVVERFYPDLYASNARLGNSIERARLAEPAPRVTKDEVVKALKGMKRGKAAGEDGITVDLLKDGGDIALGKLAKLFSECLRILKLPLA